MLYVESDDTLTQYLTIDEICEYLNVGHFTAYRLARDPRVHGVKLANRWMIPKDALDQLLFGEKENSGME